VLEVNDLVLGYGNKVVVDDLDFFVKAGDFLLVIGENGTGKSTLIKALLKLHKPFFGDIKFSINRTHIGYLPQQNDIQKDFPALVKEVVLSGCLNQLKWYQPFYTKKEHELVAKALETANITDLAESCYRELSGGQQQRVLLARALCASSKMLLLDEPVAGLDPKATKEMYELIEVLNKNYKVTVIMVTHDVEVALKYASHVLKIEKGGSWKYESV
jgi:zinc transport system ATP-binding protein